MKHAVLILLLVTFGCGESRAPSSRPSLTPEAEALVQVMLTSEDLDARTAAHKELAALGPVVVPRMIEILEADQGNDGTGAWAAEVLISLGPEALPAAEALTQQLMETTECNATTSTALVGLGARGVPYLVRALSAEIPGARMWAVEGLADLAEHAEEAIPAILERLDDEDAGVRSSALTALSSFGAAAHPRATARLLALLSSDDDTTRWDAVLGLAAAVPTDAAVRDRLAKLAKDDPDELVREAAVEALAEADGE
ncbi:MAG: HEAT repeat domain-containing protein [Planctomycetota bacterium]|nr:HEAT repeat domain-containing protein [Planctomycetota bacterium]